MNDHLLKKLAYPVAAALIITFGVRAEEMDRNKLTRQLVKHEGRRSKVYKDTEGVPTIGVGFNLNRPDAKKKIEALGLSYDMVRDGEQELSERQIDDLLVADIDAAVADCNALFPKFADLSDVRQRALADMAFNLGPARLKSFKKMIASVNNENFVGAADEMKDSQWYRQVKKRGETLESMMRTGKDPE
jgi:GH24 family phage-related lysozyme (muramidase)